MRRVVGREPVRTLTELGDPVQDLRDMYTPIVAPTAPAAESVSVENSVPSASSAVYPNATYGGRDRGALQQHRHAELEPGGRTGDKGRDCHGVRAE